MIIIPLQSIPNQQLLTVLDNNQWDIQVKSVNGAIGVSLSLNSAPVIDNQRAVSGTPIIPSRYKEAGNFIILCQNFAVPDYTQFGVTQFLVYISQAELDAFRAPTPPPTTAASFNPIASLPLRFAPQGYVLTLERFMSARTFIETFVGADLEL